MRPDASTWWTSRLRSKHGKAPVRKCRGLFYMGRAALMAETHATKAEQGVQVRILLTSPVATTKLRLR